MNRSEAEKMVLDLDTAYYFGNTDEIDKLKAQIVAALCAEPEPAKRRTEEEAEAILRDYDKDQEEMFLSMIDYLTEGAASEPAMSYDKFRRMVLELRKGWMNEERIQSIYSHMYTAHKPDHSEDKGDAVSFEFYVPMTSDGEPMISYASFGVEAVLSFPRRAKFRATEIKEK